MRSSGNGSGLCGTLRRFRPLPAVTTHCNPDITAKCNRAVHPITSRAFGAALDLADHPLQRTARLQPGPVSGGEVIWANTSVSAACTRRSAAQGDFLAQQVGISGLLHDAARIHGLVGLRWSPRTRVCERPRTTGKPPAKPLACDDAPDSAPAPAALAPSCTGSRYLNVHRLPTITYCR